MLFFEKSHFIVIVRDVRYGRFNKQLKIVTVLNQ